MHFYLYDKALSQKKFEGTLTKIEQRLIELGINGHIEKLSVLKSIPNLISEAVLRGATTIVVAGSDHTLLQVIESIGNFKQAVLGYIPMDENSLLAPIFGIPIFEDACNVLSMRIIEQMDLGVVNDQHFFLGSLELPAQTEVELNNGSFRVGTIANTEHLAITNLGRMFANDRSEPTNATDGRLEIGVVMSEKRGLFRRGESGTDSTFVSFTHARIQSPDLREYSVAADQTKTYSTPIEVRIAPGQLKLIVGKGRKI